MANLPAMRWTLRRALAALALALGLVARAGNPQRGHTVTLDTQELATIVSSKVDHVTVQDLADWIIRGASDYRLVDLRTPEEFAGYHIPNAENIPLTELPDFGLGRNEKIVLYSEGGIHSAQAWMLLRAQGFHGVYILFGGLDAWNDEVLHPIAPSDSSAEAVSDFARAAQVARYFGGGPRAASAGRADTLALSEVPGPGTNTPQVSAPMLPVAPAGKGRAAGKKKEGC
jgi:rhodanese-related sulfurtransferase